MAVVVVRRRMMLTFHHLLGLQGLCILVGEIPS